MILEIDKNFKNLDKMTQDIILQDYYDNLIEEGVSKENAKIQIDMIKYELLDI